jgi:hypothetical protein
VKPPLADKINVKLCRECHSSKMGGRCLKGGGGVKQEGEVALHVQRTYIKGGGV